MRHAVETDPRNSDLQLDLAQLLAQMGKAEQAQAASSAISSSSSPTISRRSMPSSGLRWRPTISTRPRRRRRACRAAAQAGRGYLYQGMVAEERKHHQDALRSTPRRPIFSPVRPNRWRPRCVCWSTSKRLPEAIKRLDAVSAKYPRASFALVIKGELLIQAGQALQAKDVFQQAIARTPKWWPPYRGLAKAELAAKEDPAVAITTLRNAKSVVDRKEELSVELASLLEQTGKPNDAIQEYEEILHGDPQSEVAANNLAMLLATYRSDPASLDRAKELSMRFANSPNPSYLGYLWMGSVQARRRGGIRAGADEGRRQGSGCGSRALSPGDGAVAGRR